MSFYEKLTLQRNNLVDSKHFPADRKQKLVSHLGRMLLKPVAPSTQYPLPNPVVFNTHIKSALFTTHYGIMVPDLPAPHHFLACASIIGFPGVTVFDIDSVTRKNDGPRYTSTLSYGTAVANQDSGFSSYSIKSQMKTHSDGSLLNFNDELIISGEYPNYRLKGNRGGLKVDFMLEATGDVTWFAKGFLYEHLALTARYKGCITHDNQELQVSGLCTYEYAKIISLASVANKTLPTLIKTPIKFFTYQTIKLDDNTQLLLSHLRAPDYPTYTAAYIVYVGTGSKQVNGEVRFRVLSTQDDTGIAPDGSQTVLPLVFEWHFYDKDDDIEMRIVGEVDTPMLFGLGNGFIGGYKWYGSKNGVDIEGRGYIEYVDKRFD